jgi:hypothetical protein
MATRSRRHLTDLALDEDQLVRRKEGCHKHWWRRRIVPPSSLTSIEVPKFRSRSNATSSSNFSFVRTVSFIGNLLHKKEHRFLVLFFLPVISQRNRTEWESSNDDRHKSHIPPAFSNQFLSNKIIQNLIDLS